MAKLATPVGLKLDDDVTGREAIRLRITFATVPDATSYVVWIDGVPSAVPVMPGDWVGPLHENTSYTLAVQARAPGFQDSDLSAPLIAVTRPPTPHAPERVAFDLSTWGIVLQWSESAGWNGAALASVQLLRGDGGAAAVPINPAPLGLSARYVDTDYPAGVDKAYALRITVPSAVLGFDNQSAIGPSTHATGPIAVAAAGTLLYPIDAAREQSRRMTRRLLHLPF